MTEVLVVEDDEDIRELISILLARAGHRVLTAADGREALRLVYSARPSLVILDISMPELDGWGTIERIRDFSDVPVLFLTARATEADKVRGLLAGADDYVTKPFGRQELLARVEAQLRRARLGDATQAGSPVTDDGAVTIDAARRTVTVMDAPVSLTPLEFRLLQTFVDHPDQVLSRHQLAELVWNDHTGGPTDQVKLYVGYLRRKLEAASPTGSCPLIRTVRGFGYRYDPAAVREPADR